MLVREPPRDTILEVQIPRLYVRIWKSARRACRRCRGCSAIRGATATWSVPGLVSPMQKIVADSLQCLALITVKHRRCRRPDVLDVVERAPVAHAERSGAA